MSEEFIAVSNNNNKDKVESIQSVIQQTTLLHNPLPYSQTHFAISRPTLRLAGSVTGTVSMLVVSAFPAFPLTLLFVVLREKAEVAGSRDGVLGVFKVEPSMVARDKLISLSRARDKRDI